MDVFEFSTCLQLTHSTHSFESLEGCRSCAGGLQKDHCKTRMSDLQGIMHVASRGGWRRNKHANIRHKMCGQVSISPVEENEVGKMIAIEGGGRGAVPEGGRVFSIEVKFPPALTEALTWPGKENSRQRALQAEAPRLRYFYRFGRKAECPGSLDGVQRRQWGVKDAELGVQRGFRPKDPCKPQ